MIAYSARKTELNTALVKRKGNGISHLKKQIAKDIKCYQSLILVSISCLKFQSLFACCMLLKNIFLGGIPFFFGNISLFGIYLKIGIEVVAYILTHNTV